MNTTTNFRMLIKGGTKETCMGCPANNTKLNLGPLAVACRSIQAEKPGEAIVDANSTYPLTSHDILPQAIAALRKPENSNCATLEPGWDLNAKPI